MSNSTTEELEERPFTREIYNYLRKVEIKNYKEFCKKELGHVFVTKCKTKCLSEPKPANVKIFNEKIRESLRNSKTNKTENELLFCMETVYEMKNEDLDQSILVNSNSENVVKVCNEENVITDNDLSLNEVNTTYKENTNPDAVFENVNNFSKLLGPYPDEPFLAAFDKFISLMLKQDQQ